MRKFIVCCLLLVASLLFFVPSASAHSLSSHKNLNQITHLTHVNLQSSLVYYANLIGSNLYGSPDVDYNANTMPASVLAYWHNLDPSGSMTSSGNLQCVPFVMAVYYEAGRPLPVLGDANQLWSLYAQRSGFTEIPGGSGLPAAGDIIAWQGGEFGHAAVVTSVTPPSGGQNGSVTFEEANGWGPSVTQIITPDNVMHTWAGYTVQGYIRAS